MRLAAFSSSPGRIRGRCCGSDAGALLQQMHTGSLTDGGTTLPEAQRRPVRCGPGDISIGTTAIPRLSRAINGDCVKQMLRNSIGAGEFTRLPAQRRHAACREHDVVVGKCAVCSQSAGVATIMLHTPWTHPSYCLRTAMLEPVRQQYDRVEGKVPKSHHCFPR